MNPPTETPVGTVSDPSTNHPQSSLAPIALPASVTWRRDQHIRPIRWLSVLIVANVGMAVASYWPPAEKSLAGFSVLMAFLLCLPLKQHLRAMTRNKCWLIDARGVRITKWEKRQEVVVEIPWEQVRRLTLPAFKPRETTRQSSFALGEMGVHYDPQQRSVEVPFEELKHKYIRLDEFLPPTDEAYRTFYDDLHTRLSAWATAQGLPLEEVD